MKRNTRTKLYTIVFVVELLLFIITGIIAITTFINNNTFMFRQAVLSSLMCGIAALNNLDFIIADCTN